MTQLLVSVTDLNEAYLAKAAGVDLIDLKNPATGALGALSLQSIQEVAQALPGHRLSATIGDLPLVPEIIAEAVTQVAATGVDYIKIGLFPGGDLEATLAALRPLAQNHALIGVLFADHPLALPVIDALAESGFAGVMLDTAHKHQGSLTELRPLDFLERFIHHARRFGLLTGLAGSLGLKDIPMLSAIEPDYLGFRGALCQAGIRTGRLDPKLLCQLRKAIPS